MATTWVLRGRRVQEATDVRSSEIGFSSYEEALLFAANMRMTMADEAQDIAVKTHMKKLGIAGSPAFS